MLLRDDTPVILDLRGYWLKPGAATILERRPFAAEYVPAIGAAMQSFDSKHDFTFRQCAVYIQASNATRLQMTGPLGDAGIAAYPLVQEFLQSVRDRQQQALSERTALMALHEAVSRGLATVDVPSIDTPKRSRIVVRPTAKLGDKRLSLWIVPGTTVLTADGGSPIGYLSAAGEKIAVQKDEPAEHEVVCAVYDLKNAGPLPDRCVVGPPDVPTGALLAGTRSPAYAQLHLSVAADPDVTYKQLEDDPTRRVVVSHLLIGSDSVDSAKRQIALAKTKIDSVTTANGELQPYKILSGTWTTAGPATAHAFKLDGIRRYLQRRGVEGADRTKRLREARIKIRKEHVHIPATLELQEDASYRLRVEPTGDAGDGPVELVGPWFWAGDKVKLVIPEDRADEFSGTPPFCEFAFYNGNLNGGKDVFGDIVLLERPAP